LSEVVALRPPLKGMRTPVSVLITMSDVVCRFQKPLWSK
jgi:hypothetical protein